MIIQCKSCEKKFNVPDGAIGKEGRLVQCSSCGNKWTQYPVKQAATKIVKNNIPTIANKKLAPVSKKTKVKKKRMKPGPQIYSAEYLNKKHGLKISPDINNQKKIKTKISSEFGFYSYLFLFLIIFIAAIGIINLTQEILIFNFPFVEKYIFYLFETINNFIIIFKEIFSLESIQ